MQRAEVVEVLADNGYFNAEARACRGDPDANHEVEAMRRALIAQFDAYVKLNKENPPEILTSLAGIDNAGRLADTIARICR